MKALLSALVIVSAAKTSLAEKDKPPSPPTLRWAEGEPGCTFSRGEDGKYRFGLWTADFGIVLAVDSQELEKVRRRTPPLLSLEVAFRYRSADSLRIDPSKITLEFVKHYNDIQHALDPDGLIDGEKKEAEALPEQTAREVRKHPEKKSAKELAMTARQQDIAEMIAFLTTRSLRAVTLDATHAEASGWIFFTTQSKWIDEIKKQEVLVLRIPVAERVVEFPFALPPSEDDLILRRRGE